MRCAIWYHLYNLKNAWVFFTFLKLYKWYQIAQRIKFKPITALLNATKACGYGNEKNYEAPRTEK